MYIVTGWFEKAAKFLAGKVREGMVCDLLNITNESIILELTEKWVTSFKIG